MKMPLIIRPANPDEAQGLSELALRSKVHWGYPSEFMQARIEELTVKPAHINNSASHYVVARLGDEVVGFYALEDLRGDELELAAIFVEPKHIGTGVGRQLIQEAKCHAAGLGAQKMNIQSDPNAEKFYRSAGGKKTGSSASGSIVGRFLSTFQIALSNNTP